MKLSEIVFVFHLNGKALTRLRKQWGPRHESCKSAAAWKSSRNFCCNRFCNEKAESLHLQRPSAFHSHTKHFIWENFTVSSSSSCVFLVLSKLRVAQGLSASIISVHLQIGFAFSYFIISYNNVADRKKGSNQMNGNVERLQLLPISVIIKGVI